MRIILAITLVMLCAVNTLAQDTKMKEVLAKNVPVYVAGISRTRYETTDGSAQIGRIISELEAGWVLFGPCTGKVLREQRENLRETKVTCDDEPDGPPEGIWAISCNATMSPTLTRAMVDALKGDAVGGEFYRSAGQGDKEVEQLDSPANGWKVVGNANCVDDQLLEMQYLSATEAMSIGVATGVDVSKGLMALYPPDQ